MLRKGKRYAFRLQQKHRWYYYYERSKRTIFILLFERIRFFHVVLFSSFMHRDGGRFNGGRGRGRGRFLRRLDGFDVHRRFPPRFFRLRKHIPPQFLSFSFKRARAEDRTLGRLWWCRGVLHHSRAKKDARVCDVCIYKTKGCRWNACESSAIFPFFFKEAFGKFLFRVVKRFSTFFSLFFVILILNDFC